MYKYIIYTIEAIEDLKLAKTNVQIDAEESMDYITGSSIRGAYIYKYIKEHKILDINIGEHRDKLLKGGIKFLNAYPLYEGKRSIPFPKCYFAPKQEIRNFNSNLKLHIGLDSVLGQGLQRVRLSEFGGYREANYTRINVDRKVNLHINKSREKNILFRYDAIKKGQKFKGIIKVEKEEYLEEVLNLLSGSIVYIGGSKGSGYGKCKILNMKKVDSNPEFDQFSGKYDFDREIYLLALSDIIYKSNLGEYKTYIDPEFVGKALNIDEIKFIDSVIETKRITSFNNKWNCHTPQIVGIKAGSVYKYSIKGKINEDLLLNFMDKGIGDRKADGFGRFVILDSMEDSYLYSENSSREIKEDINILIERMTQGEREQVESIFNKIYEQRIDSYINTNVLKIYKCIKNPKKMEDSQWGNYLAMFSTLFFEEPEKGKKKYKDYMNHIKNKRSTSFKQLDRLSYGGQKLIEFLDDFVDSSSDIDKFYQEKNVEKIEIEDIKSNIDCEFVYKKNMNVLTELCRYHLRKGDNQ